MKYEEMSNIEMKKIEGVKVSDVFDLTKVGFPSFWTDKQVLVGGRAIANYDKLTADLADAQKEILVSLIKEINSLKSKLTIEDYIKSNEASWKKCHRTMVNIKSLRNFKG